MSETHKADDNNGDDDIYKRAFLHKEVKMAG